MNKLQQHNPETPPGILSTKSKIFAFGALALMVGLAIADFKYQITHRVFSDGSTPWKLNISDRKEMAHALGDWIIRYTNEEAPTKENGKLTPKGISDLYESYKTEAALHYSSALTEYWFYYKTHQKLNGLTAAEDQQWRSEITATQAIARGSYNQLVAEIQAVKLLTEQDKEGIIASLPKPDDFPNE
jgi:hypothetical protein